jgi:hypothetical protein
VIDRMALAGLRNSGYSRVETDIRISRWSFHAGCGEAHFKTSVHVQVGEVRFSMSVRRPRSSGAPWRLDIECLDRVVRFGSLRDVGMFRR